MYTKHTHIDTHMEIEKYQGLNPRLCGFVHAKHMLCHRDITSVFSSQFFISEELDLYRLLLLLDWNFTEFFNFVGSLTCRTL